MAKLQNNPHHPILQNHFNTNIGVWQLDCMSSRIVFDDAARAIIDSTNIYKEHLTVKDFFHALQPGSGAQLAEQFYQFILTNDHFLSHDYCLTDNTGQDLWIRMHGSVTKRDTENTPLQAHGTIVDVSQEKQQQRKLHRETQRARDILHAVDIGTWEWVCAKDSVMVDQKAREILGFADHDSPQYIFCHWLKQIHRDDKALVEKGLNNILLNSEESFSPDSLEYRYEKTPNNFIWIQVKAHKPAGNSTQLARVRGTIIDITQRKTAEINALKFKQHIKNVIDATDMGSWEWHCKEDIWDFNPRFLDMFGWPQNQTVSHKSVQSVINRDDFAKERHIFQRFLLGKFDTYQGDFRVRHKNGHWIWVRTFARRKGDRKGQRVQTIVGYNLDITKQKQDEIRLATTQSFSHKLNLCSKELLQNNEDALQRALEHLHEAAQSSRAYLFQVTKRESHKVLLQLTNESLAPGVASEKEALDRYLLSSTQTPFRDWAKRFQRGEYIYGCRGDFLPEQNEFLLSINTQSVIMAPIFAKGQWLGVVVFEEKQLKRNWTNDEISFVQHCAEIIGSYILRKKTENDLIKSEERLRSMMENSCRGIWETDIDGKLNYLTHSDLFDKKNAFIASSIKNIFDYLSPADADKNKQRLAESIKDRKSFPNQRTWITKGDGTRACYATSAIPLFDAQNELTGFRGIYSDITQEVAQEKQIQESLKMQALGELAGGIAHDFNNQLTGIMGYATLLHEGIATEEHPNFAKNILTCAKRSADLTQQLLTFSKHSQIPSHHVNLKQIIDEICSILSHSIDKKIELEKNLPQAALIVKGDASLLQNAFLNLALNAKDAIRESGTISFHACSTQLSQGACEWVDHDLQAGEYAKITLSDTGCGMDEGTIQRIFEPFFSTKGTQGTGMGLSTAHGTITQHGGALEVHSQVDKGSHFTIYLPLCSELPVSQNKKEENDLSQQSQHIVLIDDEQHILEIGSLYLQDQGYRVTNIENGQDAISYIEENHHDIDLVISDMIMPEMNGWQVFQAMKQFVDEPNFIFVSGYNDEVDNGQMREAGITAFIPKPFTKQHFLSTIAKAFDKEEQTAHNSEL